MTKILFVAFSHSLTEDQVSDAKLSLGVEKVVTLQEVDPVLQKEFSQVPAQASTEDIFYLAAKVVDRAIKAGASHFYVAGEPGVVVRASILAKLADIKVVQSTTARDSVEEIQEDGTVKKTAVFKHVQWRSVF